MSVFKARKWILNGTTASTSKSIAHTMLIENGFILPNSKGLYSLMPLGQRVIDKLCRIIDIELQKVGAMKMSLPVIGTKHLWEKNGRWEGMGAEMIKFGDRLDNQLCLQPTAEEMCTEMAAKLSPMKKSMFPVMFYQIGEKFRDEMNPRFGFIRARQFLMKDLYSFDTSEENATSTYKKVCGVYDRLFKDILELDIIKVHADSGIHGGSLSHEYHLISNLEEDYVKMCNSCGRMSKDDEDVECCAKTDWKKVNTIEVGHTFHLGTKYSEVFGAKFNGKPLDMCCFGIGISRLLPSVVDILTVSDKAMRFPRAIAPFDVVIIPKKSILTNVITEMTVSSALRYLKGGILIDDRVEMSPGKRLHDANRLGISLIVVLANETERSLSSPIPVIEVFTTQPQSDEVVSHGSMSLTQFVRFIQSMTNNSSLQTLESSSMILEMLNEKSNIKI